MSNKQTPQDMIDSYRKQQKQAPVLFGILGILLVIVAAIIIFMALNPGGIKMPVLNPTPTFTATSTATATNTATPTPLPTSTNTPLPPTDTPTVTLTPTASGPSVYIVQEGDNLYTIAATFQTTIPVLLALNPAIDPSTLIIRLGDQIIIPGPETLLPSPTPLPENIPAGTLIDYRIAVNDTLEGIAARYNSTLEKILEKNPQIENANDIQVGQVIKIPVNIATPVPTATKGTVYPTAPIPPTATPKP